MLQLSKVRPTETLLNKHVAKVEFNSHNYLMLWATVV